MSNEMVNKTFEVYCREYLCMSEDNIKREVQRFNHCKELVNQ